MRTFRPTPEDAGRRLDLFLAEQLALSRAQVRRLLARGAVTVDGRPAAANDKGAPLPAGSTVEVAPHERPDDQRAIPEPDVAIRVLAEGPGWLALDKPAGTPVHPLAEDERGTLLGAVIARHPGIQGIGEKGLRSGVVHRLDVDTSGCLVLATEPTTWQRLRDAFAEHRVTKVYRALVAGRVEAGSIEVGLAMARHRPARVRVVDAAEAERSRSVRITETSWKPIEHRGDTSLVEIRPRTGHLHQIRVTFAHLGHPLLGDRTYAPPKIAARAPRHLLHAAELRFEEIAASAAMPADWPH
ncbi:MAG: RluA family pseudouridine synthase [Myxococcales bacterium]|nr:RluA family pseudouridine synthase [Myxococcales bacterium]